MTQDVTQLTLHESQKLLREGSVSSLELTRAYLAAINKKDAALGCFLTPTEESALQEAKIADKRLRTKSHLSPLTGIPIALKDIFVTKGVRTTCASKILENYIPPYNGTVVQKLIDAGAVFLGKLNMDEFAMGSSNEHSAFFPVKNPWNRCMVPGGSSGGSAAAVAAGLCAASLGTDTGGSIRQPAALCGVVGLKPTYGRVSRYGIIAFASSLDQVGPITKDVTDAALLLQAIAGRDPYDATSTDIPVPDYTHDLQKNIKGLRIGIPKEYFIEGIDTEVEAAVRHAVEELKHLGAQPIDITLPHTRYAVPTYYIIAPAEASANLARYDGVRYGFRTQEAKSLEELFEKSRSQGFGPEVTLRILVGTYVLSSGYYDAYYRKAQKVRTLIQRDFLNAFEKVDVIVAPTSPTAAFRLGEHTDDPVRMYLNDIFTIPINLAGLPGLSLPCGMTTTHLPIGLQFIGRPFDETTLLRMGYAFEQATVWHTMRPPDA